MSTPWRGGSKRRCSLGLCIGGASAARRTKGRERRSADISSGSLDGMTSRPAPQRPPRLRPGNTGKLLRRESKGDKSLARERSFARSLLHVKSSVLCSHFAPCAPAGRRVPLGADARVARSADRTQTGLLRSAWWSSGIRGPWRGLNRGVAQLSLMDFRWARGRSAGWCRYDGTRPAARSPSGSLVLLVSNVMVQY